MANQPINVRIPNDLRDRIDALRGDVPRETWIRRELSEQVSRWEQHRNPSVSTDIVKV